MTSNRTLSEEERKIAIERRKYAASSLETKRREASGVKRIYVTSGEIKDK